MGKFIKVKCKNCSKIFLKDKGHYKENLKFGHNFYCSRECESKYKTRKRRILKCENCGKEFRRAVSAISPHNYCSYFCAAIINNRKRPERGAKTIECENCGKKFKKWVLRNKKYCSRACLANAKFYTAEKLLKIIKTTARQLKRTPARREVSRGVDKACVRFFGSWNNAVSTAGFTPNRSHDNKMYKRANAKAIDGHLCDSISEVLIDNWLHKNNIRHEKDVPYPGTKHKADWQIMSKNQKIFVEYFGLANDSPRYDRSVNEKRALCKEKNISLIGIYPKDLYPKIYLDNNLKNKFEDYMLL